MFDALQSRLSREKQATGSVFDAPWRFLAGNDPVQQAKGWLLAGMLATGAGTGYAMYNHTKAKNTNVALQRALQQRARRRAALNPSPPLIIADGEAGEDKPRHAF